MSSEQQFASAVWQASGGITDPEIWVGEKKGAGPTLTYELSAVASPTRLDLFGGEIVLFLMKGDLVFYTTQVSRTSFPYYKLLYYLCYRSRVNYNILCPPIGFELPEGLEPKEEIIFSLEKLVLVETEEKFCGDSVKFSHHKTEPFSITINKVEIEQYLENGNLELHLAISYFLLGCENIRYFLIEFYKALEVIKQFFGNEDRLSKALKPYGFSRNDYGKLKRYCNDQRNPLNVGRHAPLPGAAVQFIGFRRLLSDPLSKEVWKDSVSIARQTIDAFSAYLMDHASGKGS